MPNVKPPALVREHGAGVEKPTDPPILPHPADVVEGSA